MQSLRVARSRGQLRRREQYEGRSASKHSIEPPLLYNSNHAVIHTVDVPGREHWEREYWGWAFLKRLALRGRVFVVGFLLGDRSPVVVCCSAAGVAVAPSYYASIILSSTASSSYPPFEKCRLLHMLLLKVGICASRSHIWLEPRFYRWSRSYLQWFNETAVKIK